MNEWGPAEAAPLADLHAVKLLTRGYSVPLSDHLIINLTTYHALRKAGLPYQRLRRRIVPWLLGRTGTS